MCRKLANFAVTKCHMCLKEVFEQRKILPCWKIFLFFVFFFKCSALELQQKVRKISDDASLCDSMNGLCKILDIL